MVCKKSGQIRCQINYCRNSDLNQPFEHWEDNIVIDPFKNISDRFQDRCKRTGQIADRFQ